jgi:lipoprotein NlpI
MTIRSSCFSLTLLAGLLFAAPALPSASSGNVALLIGNANYADGATTLPLALNDTRTLADEFRRNNFDVEVRENLGVDEMRRTIEAFMGRIRSGSAAVFYFNGHGIQAGRQTFLLPINAQVSSEASVRRDGINVDATVAEMHKRGAKVQVVIVDAARRNPYETRFRTSPAGLATLDMPEGTVALYSTAPGKLTTDGKGPNSLLVTELVREMRVGGRPAEEVFNRTRIAVSRATNNEQNPWVATSLIEPYTLGQTMQGAAPAVSASTQPAQPLPTSTTPTKAPPVIATPAPVRPSPPVDSEDEIRRDYQFAETASTRKAWEDFLARHPSGRYSDLAREKLAKLTSRPEPSRPAPAPTPPRQQITVAPMPAPQPQPAPMVEGSDDPAIVELDGRIKQNTNDAAAYYKRGQLYAQHGSFRRAIEDFDVVLRISPRDAEALNNRCWARAVVGDLQAALNDCGEAMKIRPRYVDAFDSRGFTYLKLGKPRDAIKDYDAALKINTRHVSALYGRGLAKIRIGDSKGGNNDIESAKRIQPDIVDEFASYGIR